MSNKVLIAIAATSFLTTFGTIAFVGWAALYY